MGMNEADAVTREIYADVLGENNDPAMVRLVQDLEWGYTSVTVPPALRSKPPRPAAGRLPELRRPRSTWTDMPRRWRMHTKLYAALAVVVTGAILLATGVSMAGSTQPSITNLGPPLPVQSTNAGFPLSGFPKSSYGNTCGITNPVRKTFDTTSGTSSSAHANRFRQSRKSNCAPTVNLNS